MPYLLRDDGEIERCAATHRNTLVRRDYGPDLPLTRTVPPRERRRRARAGTRGRRGARPVNPWEFPDLTRDLADAFVAERVYARRPFRWTDEWGQRQEDALFVPSGCTDDAARAALVRVERILRGDALPARAES